MTIQELNNIRPEIYKKLLTLLYNTHCGHIGSSLSCLDILISIFIFNKKENDKFILSKGHAAPALYTILNETGAISNKDFATFHAEGTLYPAHPPNNFYDIFPFPTGSLGHGLALASGIAHGYKLKKNKNDFLFCLMSDGECNEGSVWEAVQYVSFHKLSNLITLVDKNEIQAFGRTQDVLGDPTTPAKWRAFGFKVHSCTGHNIPQLNEVISQIKKTPGKKPHVILCNTTKGFGVSFMENSIDWHYLPMSEKQYTDAIAEVAKLKDYPAL